MGFYFFIINISFWTFFLYFFCFWLFFLRNLNSLRTGSSKDRILQIQLFPFQIKRIHIQFRLSNFLNFRHLNCSHGFCPRFFRFCLQFRNIFRFFLWRITLYDFFRNLIFPGDTGLVNHIHGFFRKLFFLFLSLTSKDIPDPLWNLFLNAFHADLNFRLIVFCRFFHFFSFRLFLRFYFCFRFFLLQFFRLLWCKKFRNKLFLKFCFLSTCQLTHSHFKIIGFHNIFAFTEPENDFIA